MTPSQEVKYLTGLLAESTRWTRDPDETKSSIELEICWRIDHLLPEAATEPPAELDVEKEPEYPKGDVLSTPHRRYAETHVRVLDPATGKKKWYRRELCEKVPIGNGNPGFKWVRKTEVQE